ncbi:MAG: FkbM family methyltransferase [candidate division KSB1 bacterium]|nr:FkbM family methyltransferase [candidate division KSB1 bacterium]MDZ7275635.1 FkbM family methyltransferase [candidate division KSB1 bacterium]MDZ7284674.1 FkbM family methyltransferase [candidate division KSB1 bacterium]MDZ7297907.1 FkbM family methyltransferase [candidate division KSB1 bacterium]MDZ7305965.1 FkbM family methyltransferase [candidate division KSB1 bacterium]
MQQLLSLLESPAALKALLTWPQFSITSYRMVSALVKQGLRPATVLDVGANVGQFAVAAARLFPGVHVHSFEPLPECVTRLRRHAARLGNISVHPVALGERAGEMAMRVNAQSRASSLLPLAPAHREAFPAAQEECQITVRVATLDEMLAGTTLPPPVLLKIDVQGYEAQTLRGATRTLPQVDYAVLETSFKPLYNGELLFMDLVRLMENQGMRFSRPVGWLAAPKTGEVLQMDALFVRASEL